MPASCAPVFVRWCFVVSDERLAEGVWRLRNIMVRGQDRTPQLGASGFLFCGD